MFSLDLSPSVELFGAFSLIVPDSTFLVYKVIYFHNVTILDHEVLSGTCAYITRAHISLNHVDHALDQRLRRNNFFHARWINTVVDWKSSVMFSFDKPLFVSDIFLQFI